jgi:hypothetical protein
VKDQADARYQLLTQLRALAQDKVNRSVQEMVTELDGRTTRPVRTSLLARPGINTVEPEPIAVVEAARELERTARALTIGHIQAAREAGRNWREIGDALDLLPAAAANKISTAEEAYDSATGTWRSEGLAQVR